MRSHSEKWEPNVVARLISMNWSGWRLQESQLWRHRANAKTVTVDNTSKQGLGAPGEAVQFGYLKSLTKKGSSYELRFDPALFLSGQTANAAAAEDGAVKPGEPVPNDYYAKLTVVALGPKNIPITVEALAKIVAGKQAAPWMPISSGFWLRSRIDTVRSLDQQYRP